MQNLTREGFTLVLSLRYESAHLSSDPLNEVQQKWMNDEIPSPWPRSRSEWESIKLMSGSSLKTLTHFNFDVSEYSNRIKTKKGLSDDVKDIQIKALQTGFEKMIEDCEKAECRHKLMASFFNESDLKKCVEEL